MQFTIRTENNTDFLAIKQVNDLAFEQDNEGILIEKLRKRPEFISELSLVAEFEGSI
ncbi:MAG: N-acetyltransferase, partial [Bacteroidia bacterium]|nr:N-acetyltransferase [Bacteroidia bacterium]